MTRDIKTFLEEYETGYVWNETKIEDKINLLAAALASLIYELEKEGKL